MVKTMDEDKTAWEKLNDKQRQFVLNRLNKMPRVDAYMDAYSMKDRDVAKTAVSRLMLTNVHVKEILSQHFSDCLDDAKAILKAEAPEAARQIIEIMHMGNREYGVRLQAATYILKAMGVEEPTKKAVELSGEVSHVVQLKDVIKEVGLRNGKSTERGNDG